MNFLVNEQFEITDDFMRVIWEAALDEEIADNLQEIAQFLKRNLSFLNHRDKCSRYELEAYNQDFWWLAYGK